MNRSASSTQGFTLVELLVVITIILLLAGWGVTKMIGVQRDAELTKSKGNLGEIYAQLKRYEIAKGRMPDKAGPDFLLAVWGKPFLEKSKNNAEIFFCPSVSRPPLSEDEEVLDEWVNAENIHYTGRNQEDKQYRVGRSTMENSSKIIIACNKPEVLGEKPHAGNYLAVLYLNGAVGHIDASEWGEGVDVLTIGPDSPVEALHGLVDYQ